MIVAATLHALFVGWTGLTFGFSLWDIHDPSPTVHWVAAIAFPIVLFTLVSRAGVDMKRLVFISVGAWAFVAYYLLFNLGDGHILDCGFRWFCA